MDLKNKQVLITGADGFIGSHIVEALLEKGCKVRAFVFYNSFNSWGWIDTFPKEKVDKIEIFPGDIRDPYGIKSAMNGIDLVIHLAALISIPFSYIAPDCFVDTNIKGTLNILQAARLLKTKKVLVTSTSEVYGTAQYVPIDEKHPLQGQSPYSASKIGADMIAESFYRSFDLPVTIVRPFNTYGPRQSSRAVIPNIITQVLNNKKEIFADSKLELEKKEGEKNLVIQRIKNIQGKIAELEEFKKRINDERKNAQQLGMLSDVMSSFRTYLISRIRPTLSSYASDYFERLTDGKYREMELDEDYNIMIYDDSNSYSIQRFSGGEEDLANLCLRLAISEVITERAGGVFNFIILDEIFGSQDMIRRQNIMKALNGLSSKFRQIFLVTHIDDVKNYVENVIYVNENEDRISTVKIE